MNKAILQADVQEFINNNLSADIPKLLFQKSPFKQVTTKELAEQIEAKRKIEKKLPTWFALKKTYFANKLNISQTSSELTAAYKASVVSGNSLADLTAGFGVDAHAFSKVVKKVFHIEKNPLLSKIAQSNFEEMGVSNIDFSVGDGIKFLADAQMKLDWIYIDPSRRTKTNKKVHYLSDCDPDVTKHLDLFFSKAENVLIKTGPLLDLSIGISELKQVEQIHIIALENDVKEVLWVLKNDFKEELSIKTINLTKQGKEIFEFYYLDEKKAVPRFSEPLEYLYEPNASILKSGAFKLISKRFNIPKLHSHSHLYTASNLIDFPGRVFRIQKVISYNKKEVSRLGLEKANVSTRNFPNSVLTIRKKLKIKDGGSDYLFFTKDYLDNLIGIHCLKV